LPEDLIAMNSSVFLYMPSSEQSSIPSTAEKQEKRDRQQQVGQSTQDIQKNSRIEQPPEKPLQEQYRRIKDEHEPIPPHVKITQDEGDTPGSIFRFFLGKISP
jgi:hypothetical protein